MTIDEAISHARDKAEIHRFNSCHIDAELYADDTEAIEEAKKRCVQCAEEHEQLAEWLEELKVYREAERTLDESYDNGYNKAIDDIREKLMQNGFIITKHALDVFDNIAEQLKNS